MVADLSRRLVGGLLLVVTHAGRLPARPAGVKPRPATRAWEP